MKKTKTEKTILAAMLSFLLFVIAFFAFAFTEYAKTKDFEFRVFHNISSFRILDEYIKEPIVEDEYLDDIEFVECYRNIVEWEDKEYKVFAYTFSDVSQSQQYIKNRTDYSSKQTKNYKLSSNIVSKTRYWIYEDEHLIYIDGPSSNSMHLFLDYLQQNFD